MANKEINKFEFDKLLQCVCLLLHISTYIVQLTLSAMSSEKHTEFSLFVSSDVAAGATGVTANGSQFDVNIPENIRIPVNARNVVLRVLNATVWWTIPNITAGVNDAFHAFISGVDVNGPIPPGLYDLPALQAAMRSLMIAALVPPADAANNFALIPDQSTGHTQVLLTQAGDFIEVGQAMSCFQLCGFPYLSANATPVLTTSPDKANFNTVNYFFIHSTLSPRGVQYNGKRDGIIAKVLIDVAPGSQISFAPFNPPVCPADELAGAFVSVARFWLTDQNLRPVDTFGETWSVGMTISYDAD